VKTALPALVILVCFLFGSALESVCGDVQEAEFFYNLSLNGRKIGYQHSRLTCDKDGNLVTAENMVMRIKRFTQPVTVTNETAFVETPDGQPVTLSFQLKMSRMSQRIHAAFECDTLSVTRDAGGEKKTATYPFDSETLMPQAARRLLARQLARENATFSYKSYMPPFSLDKPSLTTVKVLGRESVDVAGATRTLHRAEVTSTMPPATMTVFVDPQGNIWKMFDAASGISMERTTREDALKIDELFDLADLAITTNFVIRDDLRWRMDQLEIEARVPGAKAGEFFLTSTRQQTRTTPDGAIRLTVKRLKPGEGERMTAEQLAAHLEPSAYLQSDDTRIIATARKATDGATDPWQKAKALETFVFKHITRTGFQVAFASAAEVLESRSGDCTEFAVLLAALCRAAELPSRLVVGLVSYKSIFFYHMWTEVYVDGWLPLDATDPQPSVDPTHLAMARLRTGDEADLALSNQKLMTGLGKVSIEIIHYTLDGKRIYPLRPDVKAKAGDPKREDTE